MSTKKSGHVELPKGAGALLELIGGLLRLPNVLALGVSAAGVDVTRMVEDEEAPAIPASLRGEIGAVPHVEELIHVITTVALSIDPGQPELHALLQAFDTLQGLAVRPVALYAPAGDELAAYLGLPANEQPTHLFGVPVHYVVGEAVDFEAVALLVGSPTPLLSDATHGVIIDIGGPL